MGKKTDKKIKSDRINVLRKQYETYLEEDKKRKDRNDYILGRLENMRYSSTAVQLRHTPKTYSDYFAPTCNHVNRPDNVERKDMQMVHVNQFMTRPDYGLQPDVPRRIEETSILKEISKKYILIPKLRTTFPNDGPEIFTPVAPAPVSSEKPNDIDNNDWKSKYDILEQLKKKEKEEEINKYGNKDYLKNNKISTLNNIADDNNHVMLQNYTKDELPTRYEEDIPEKDISDQLIVENELKSLDKCTINDNIYQIPTTDDANVPRALSMNPENAAPYYDQTQNEIFEQHAPEIKENVMDYAQPEQYVIPAEQNVEADSHIANKQYQENYPEQELLPEQEHPVEYEQFIPSVEVDANHPEHEKVFNQEENDYSPIEAISPNELVNEINKDSGQEINVAENEHPTETVNIQDLTTAEPVLLQDTQGMIPENYITEDGTIVQGNPVPQKLTDDPTDNTGIEDFDAEQREMFYSEQTDQNYAYDEQGAAAGDAYNAEYAQNQNYPQNQEYAYYEGAEQEEGTYPAEINEHEETQQLYDQHYEQQYTTNYEQGFEQQTVYMEQDPTQPQFEQPALYDKAQQEFEQYAYDQVTTETQEQVEKILDREDGYNEKRADDPTVQKDQQSAEFNIP